MLVEGRKLGVREVIVLRTGDCSDAGRRGEIEALELDLSALAGAPAVERHAVAGLERPARKSAEAAAQVGRSAAEDRLDGEPALDRDVERKSTRLNSSHVSESRMPSSA